MISEKMKALIDKYGQMGKMRFFEGASEEQIAAFEKEHGIVLPLKYKEWLQYSDGGELFLPAGIQLYGVAHKPVINVDDDDRPGKEYIVIGALCTGDPILCGISGERIAIYNHEAGRIENDEAYADFYAFIGDLDGILGLGD